MIAKQCVPVYSSWVYQVIQGCLGEFAVQFKHHVIWDQDRGVRTWSGGVPWVVCYYPHAPPTYFNLMLSWNSKGKFVHQFLYKKQPYQLIANPCPEKDCGQVTNCCSQEVPNTLQATLVNVVGCGCVGGTIPLIYDGLTQQWAGTGAFGTCGGRAVTLKFDLAALLPGGLAHDFRLDYAISDGCVPAQTGVIPDTASCQPPSWQFSATGDVNCGCVGLLTSWKVLVTT